MERISSGCGRREFSCKRVEYQVVASEMVLPIEKDRLGPIVVKAAEDRIAVWLAEGLGMRSAANISQLLRRAGSRRIDRKVSKHPVSFRRPCN